METHSIVKTVFKKVVKAYSVTIAYISASKTLLFNFALGLAGAIEAYSGFLRGIFESDKAFGIFMVIVATTGAVLRFVTSQSLREKVAKKTQGGDV